MPPPAEQNGESPVGIADGLQAFAGGIGFIVGTPSVWGYALVPMGIALLLCCGLGWLGYLGADWVSDRVLGEPGDTWSTVGYWALKLSLGLVGLVVSVFLALALAQPLSGFALEAIVRAQEQALTGRASSEPSFLASALLGLKIGLFTLVSGTAILILLFLISLFFPPAAIVTVPLKFCVVAWLLAWDFVDYPLGLRGRGVRARFRWVQQHFQAYTAFGLLWALVLLVPCVALVLLPMGVAGATRLVLRTEGVGGDKVLPANGAGR